MILAQLRMGYRNFDFLAQVMVRGKHIRKTEGQQLGQKAFCERQSRVLHNSMRVRNFSGSLEVLALNLSSKALS